jgi:hypothetical protein
MSLFACSGPGAGEAIGRSIEIGFIHAEVVGGLVALSLALLVVRPRRWLAPAVLLVLLALHPAWTVSAISGDCGQLKVLASSLFTLLGGAVLLVQVGRLTWSQLFSRTPPPSTPDR